MILELSGETYWVDDMRLTNLTISGYHVEEDPQGRTTLKEDPGDAYFDVYGS